MAVLVGEPGVRCPSKKLERFVLSQPLSVHTSTSRRCIAAALGNAVGRLFHPEKTRWTEGLAAVARAKVRKSELSLSCLRDVVHACNRNCEDKIEVKGVQGSEKMDFRKAPFNWLAEQARGVWIVRLIGADDHCIVLDTMEGIVLDSALTKPLELLEGSLRLCADENSKRMLVAEVRQVVVMNSKANFKK